MSKMLGRMRPLETITISVRLQAVCICVLFVMWLGLHCQADGKPENLPLLALAFFGFLPWLNGLLALFLLESRIRHKQRCSWWVYLAVLVGLSPWIWYAFSKLLA